MQKLSSLMIMNVDGGDRISYTYNEIDDVTGEIASRNNKKNFFAMDPELIDHINAIREYIQSNKLGG